MPSCGCPSRLAHITWTSHALCFGISSFSSISCGEILRDLSWRWVPITACIHPLLPGLLWVNILLEVSGTAQVVSTWPSTFLTRISGDWNILTQKAGRRCLCYFHVVPTEYVPLHYSGFLWGLSSNSLHCLGPNEVQAPQSSRLSQHLIPSS